MMLKLATISLFVTAASAVSVCVTGAGGYVASELVKQLLEVGYDVRGTVRSLKKPETFGHLINLDRALPGTLLLSEADLLVKGSFDECTNGVEFVFHVASPFHFEGKDGMEDMINPAVEGTENVLRSAKKGGAKRVIVTSSFVAVNSFSGLDVPKSGSLFSEEDFNTFTDDDMWKDNPMQMYIVSKAKAAASGRQLAGELGIEMVAICPSLVMGPILSQRDGVSMTFMKQVLEGGVFPNAFPWCDVRDVAAAHIMAATIPAPQKRYIVSHQLTTPPSVIHKVVAKSFPQYEMATTEEAEGAPIANNTLVKELLGRDLIGVEQTIVDMARSMYQSQFAIGVPKSVEKTEL